MAFSGLDAAAIAHPARRCCWVVWSFFSLPVALLKSVLRAFRRAKRMDEKYKSENQRSSQERVSWITSVVAL